MEKLFVSSRVYSALEHIKNNNYPLKRLVDNYELISKELSSGQQFLALEYISGNYSDDVEIIVIPEYAEKIKKNSYMLEKVTTYSSEDVSVEELQEFSDIVDFNCFKTASNTLKEWDKYHKYFK